MTMEILELVLVIILAIWTIIWKCYSVWTAVKRGDRAWFIFLLLLNTFGLLDMFYIFKVVKKDIKTVKKDFNRALNLLKNFFKFKKS